MAVSLLKAPALYSVEYVESGVAYPRYQTVDADSLTGALRVFWTEGMRRIVQDVLSVRVITD